MSCFVVRTFLSSSSNYHAIIEFRNDCIKKNQYYSKTFILIEDKLSLFVDENVINSSFRFERTSSTVDSLLFVQESEIARSRDRSQNAKNRRQEMKQEMKMMNHIDTQMMMNYTDTQMNVNEVSSTAKKRTFENSTLRQFSRFERVLIKTITSDEMLNMKTTFAVHRADSVSDRKRRRERRRERKKRERERRERRQAVSN